MNIIEKMLEAQNNGDKIILSNYFTGYDLYIQFNKALKLHEEEAKYTAEQLKQLDILKKTISAPDSNVFYLNAELSISLANLKYTNNFQKILKAFKNNKINGCKLAARIYSKYTQFGNNIESFKKRFINADLYLNDLYIIGEYLKQRDEIEKPVKVVKVEPAKQPGEILTALDEINYIYNNGLSLIDYSFYTHLKKLTYSNGHLKHVRNSKKAEIIMNMGNKTTGKILEIIDKINNNEIDILQYYELTKLNPYLLAKVAKEHNKITNQFYKFVKLLSSPKTTLENELNHKFSLNDINISDEFTIEAFQMLDEINAPYTVATYREALRKIIKKQRHRL